MLQQLSDYISNFAFCWWGFVPGKTEIPQIKLQIGMLLFYANGYASVGSANEFHNFSSGICSRQN